MRRFFLLLPVLAMGLFSCSGEQGSKDDGTDTERPNIVLFLVDDLGTNDAGCYGNPVIRTPALDALAEEGTRFTHAFCSSPSCSASRSTILTGLHNHANGQYGHSHFEFHFSAFDFIKSLPVILDSVGYRTMRVGKLHVAPPKTVFRFDDYAPKLKDYPDRVWKHFDEAPYYPHSGSAIPPVELAEDLRDFLSKDDEEPFFLYFCTWDPHHPFKREGSDTIYPEDVIVPAHLPDVPEIREELAKYYMSMQRADKGMARIMEILKESGKWENTVFLFTSDNGRPFIGAKPNHWDPGIRLPFVLYDPAAENQNIVSDAMISFVDITPTLLDYAGVDISKYNFHGRSFRSQVGQEESSGFDTIFASHTFHEIQQYYPMRTVRTRKYKLIWNLEFDKLYPLGGGAAKFPDFIERNHLTHIGKRSVKDFLYRPQYELYDLEEDPDEVYNLADDPAYVEVLESLKQAIYRFQDETGDIWKRYREYEEYRMMNDE